MILLLLGQRLTVCCSASELLGVLGCLRSIFASPWQPQSLLGNLLRLPRIFSFFHGAFSSFQRTLSVCMCPVSSIDTLMAHSDSSKDGTITACRRSIGCSFYGACLNRIAWLFDFLNLYHLSIVFNLFYLASLSHSTWLFFLFFFFFFFFFLIFVLII